MTRTVQGVGRLQGEKGGELLHTWWEVNASLSRGEMYKSSEAEHRLHTRGKVLLPSAQVVQPRQDLALGLRHLAALL